MKRPTPPSPESTGGRGTVVEHRYGGRLLAAVLLHAPVEGLPQGLVPVEVQFQGQAAVDDLVVHAEGAGGEAVTWYVASRLRPTIGTSSPETVRLFADYLQVLAEDLDAVSAGRTRLGLVTVDGHGPAVTLFTLTSVAQTPAATFRETVARRASRYRGQLENVDALVLAAAASLGWPEERGGERDWSWTLLRALSVVRVALDDTESGAIAVTTALAALVDGDPERADAVRRTLNEIAADAASGGLTLTERDIRRALVGRASLGAAPALAAAMEALGDAERALNIRTRRTLRGPAGHHVDRAGDRGTLRAALEAAARTRRPLIVHGEPAVGKSALTLELVEELRSERAAVAALGLRLPFSPGVALPRLFAGFPVGPQRVLVLDGAEVVQEDPASPLVDLAAAAHDAGITVVAVTRDDAIDDVLRALEPLGVEVARQRVAGLDATQTTALVAALPTLARLAADSRSREQLRRLGLVDLLLGAVAHEPLPEGLTEADAFRAVWEGLVLRADAGCAPQARARALRDVARARLAGRPAEPDNVEALPSLVSDHLLTRRDAFSTGEDFADDTARDLATARLLLDEGLDLLADVGAPRSALRAALVASQARLARTADPVAELRTLLAETAALAERFGARWADLPWEALLRGGRAGEVLTAVAPVLVADDAALLAELLRAAEQYCADRLGDADPVLVAPLVDWLVTEPRRLPRAVRDAADDLVLSWLRGLSRVAVTDPSLRAVRQHVRGAVLRRTPSSYDTRLVQSLATLADDLDDEARDVLRLMAAEDPYHLSAVVEDFDAVRALASADAALLAELAEAYYLNAPDPEDDHSLRWRGDALRDHQGFEPFLPRSAAWRGPFWALFNADPARAFALMRRMLAHVAEQDTPKESISVDVLGLGPRTYAGDVRLYALYRGDRGSGLAAGTSVLLACERVMDQLVAAGLPPGAVAKLVLSEATEVGSLGLVIGFLVRHIEAITDELDDVLAHHVLWELELSRATAEHSGMAVQDDEGVLDRGLRTWSLRDVAAYLVHRAQLDPSRQAQLVAVSERLLAEATARGGPSMDARRSAAMLDPRNYRNVEHDGQTWFEHVEPEDIAAELADIREGVARTSALTALRVTYHRGPPTDPELLRAHVALARAALDDPPPSAGDVHLDAVPAVAAGVLTAAVAGTEVDDAHLEWASEIVVAASVSPPPGVLDDAGSRDPWGHDRIASGALPMLFLPEVADRLTDRTAAAHDTLVAAATSRYDEVRRLMAEGLRALWRAPCGDVGSQCRHRHGWDAVLAGARDVAFGSGAGHYRRPRVAVEGELTAALAAADPRELASERLAIACAAVAAASAAPCLRDDAAALRPVLWAAFAGAMVAEGEYHYEDTGDLRLLADALLAAADADKVDLAAALTDVGGLSLAGSALLDALCVVATYDEQQRAALRRVWPPLARALLTLPPAEVPNTWRGTVAASLIPAPKPSGSLEQIDEAFRVARTGWITAGELADVVDAWLPRAAGEREAVARLTSLLLCSPIDEQVRLGLPWVRALVAPAEGSVVVEQYVLSDWLPAIRPHLDREDRVNYDVIVDALASGGLPWARQLQASGGAMPVE